MISQAAKDARRVRDKAKKARRRAKRKAAQFAALAASSKTSAAYRRKLPAMPEMSKSALRDYLAAAVRNTAMVPS